MPKYFFGSEELETPERQEPGTSRDLFVAQLSEDNPEYVWLLDKIFEY